MGVKLFIMACKIEVRTRRNSSLIVCGDTAGAGAAGFRYLLCALEMVIESARSISCAKRWAKWLCDTLISVTARSVKQRISLEPLGVKGKEACVINNY